MSEKVGFYRLAPKCKVGIEGSSRQSINFFIPFSILLFVVDLVIALVNIDSFSNFSVGYLISGGIMVFSVILFIIGFLQSKKTAAKKANEKAILKNCALTDGFITKYNCEESDTGGRKSNRKIYKVTLKYKFFDRDFEKRTGELVHEYSVLPHFYLGQPLMIAFTNHESLILNKFSFIPEDYEIFKSNEHSRSFAGFDNISGAEKQVDKTKYVSTYNPFQPYIAAGSVCLGMGIIISGIISIFTLGNLNFAGNIALIIVMISFTLIPFAFFGILAAVFLKRGFKERSVFNRVMKGNPCFTYGLAFNSNETYSIDNKDKSYYCFKDFKGNIRYGSNNTEVILEKLKDGIDGFVNVMVAYTETESVLLYHYCLVKNVISYKIAELENKIILGVTHTLPDDNSPNFELLKELWQNACDKKKGYLAKIQNKISDSIFCYYSYGDEESSITIGAEVTEVNTSELSSKFISEGKYAVFSFRGNIITDVEKMWDSISDADVEFDNKGEFIELLPCSDCENEDYCDVAKCENCNINIYVSIK